MSAIKYSNANFEDRENQQNDGLFATSDNPAPDLNLEGLNYREACEPSLGRPFDELSFPEIFDHDLSTNCKFCDDQFCPLYDDSSLVDVSFTNYDRFVVRDLDILSEASCSPPDIQLEDWFKRDNPRITTEPQQYASGHRNKVDDCDIGRGHINSINRGKYQPTTAKVERQVTPYAKLLEGSRLERNSRVDHRQSVANARPNNDQATANKRSWVCPWYKKNPLKYHECSKYKLQRIKDVKQHIWRKHTKPDIYCPRCFELFRTAKERDEHVREGGCESKAGPEFEGISEDQKKELAQPQRGKNDVEQWNCIWKILFPQTCPPKSPYLGNGWEESLPLLRNFWSNNQQKILIEALKISLPRHEAQNIQLVVDKIFDLFEAESLCWVADSDIPLENVPSKVKHEELSKPGMSHDIAPSKVS